MSSSGLDASSAASRIGSLELSMNSNNNNNNLSSLYGYESGNNVVTSISDTEISSTDKEVHILEFIESQTNYRETSVIVISTLYLILFLIGGLGNACIIYWHVDTRSTYYQRTTSNLLVINLCISDLLVILFCCPFVAYVKNTSIWRFGETACTVVHYLQGVAITSTTLSMTALSFGRYFLMQRSDLASMRKLAPLNGLFLCIVWFASTLLPVPILFVRKLKRVQLLDYSFSFCLEIWPSDTHKKLFSIITFIIVYLIPCTILVYCHTRVSLALVISNRELAARRGTTNLRDSSRKKAFRVKSSTTISSDSTTIDNLEILTNPEINAQKKMTINRRHLSRFLISITMVFVFCWLPYNVTSFYLDLTESSLALYMLPFTLVLGHSHSAINPIVYWALIRTEREKRLRAIELRSIMVQLSHNSVNERNAKSNHSNTINSTDRGAGCGDRKGNRSESKLDTTLSSCSSYRYCVRY
ncbi:galanin receptor type 1-like isoform X2 [Panonychus citri]|nr:galanin receptor type 1-like isoform X2 [Panonychus citri]